MKQKYIVRLTSAERDQLAALVKKGKAEAYRIKHANILLAIDADGPKWSDSKAAKAFGCHEITVRNIRQRLVVGGMIAALDRKKQDQPSREKILDGEKEARLIALGCSEPPKGSARWTLHLLADKLVELEIVDAISYETVRRTLKKTNFALISASAG